MSVKIGTNDYMEFTTIVVDSTKVYVNVGTIVDVIKSIDENAGAQVESVLGQIGASSYISIDLKQLYEAMGEEIPDLTKSTEKLQDVTKKVLENLDKAFSAIEGQDGDDYTLTVESENADEVAEGIVKFCNDSLKSTYTDVIDAYSDILSGNEEVQQQLDELKNKAEDLDEVIDKVKDSQDDISEAIKESKINVTAKVNVSGDEGSRKAELSISTGDIDIPDTSGIESGNINISLTSKITESEASIKDIVPESAVDLTAFITAAMSSYTDSADDTSALY
jgi:hypothetical protein